MEWMEVRVSTASEAVEIVFGVLLSCGINGAQIIDDDEMRLFLSDNPLQWDYVDEELMSASNRDAQVVFYVSNDSAGRETLFNVRDALSALAQMDFDFPLGDLTMIWETVNEEQWLNEWKKHYKPFRIGQHVIVKPVWETYEALPDDILFTIDPGSVFGTGLHQTTQLCVEALEKQVSQNCTLLDIGCGSGILSVVARLLGAKFAHAVDIDPAAVEATRINTTLNGFDVSSVEVCTGNLINDEDFFEKMAENRYDLVVANIVADVVIALSQKVEALMKPGGLFIASGIIAERIDAVLEALEANHLKPFQTLEKDGWYCVVSRQE